MLSDWLVFQGGLTPNADIFAEPFFKKIFLKD
jgi:hypothetical protein